MAAQRAAAQREEAFFGGGESVRLEPAPLAERCHPLGESRVAEERFEGGVIDGHDLGLDEGLRFTDQGEEILELAFPGQMGVVGTVPRSLQRGVVRQPLDRQSERLFKLQHLAERLGRLAHAIFPAGDFWVVLLQFFKGRLPVGGCRVEEGQVPGIRERHFSACRNGAGSGFVFVKKWLFHERVIKWHGAPAASSSTSIVRTCSCRGSPWTCATKRRGHSERFLQPWVGKLGGTRPERKKEGKDQEAVPRASDLRAKSPRATCSINTAA